MHNIMRHSATKPDAAHQALALSIITEDPDVNNFRTDQAAPVLSQVPTTGHITQTLSGSGSSVNTADTRRCPPMGM